VPFITNIYKYFCLRNIRADVKGMKILFVATHPSIGTGYGRVANKISNHLANSPGIEVIYFAFQNYKTSQISDRFIDPRIKFYDSIDIEPETQSGMGLKALGSVIVDEKPDALFIYSDLTVTLSVMNEIPNGHIPDNLYSYLDIVYPWQNVRMYQKLQSYNFNRIWVFTEYWKRHLVNDLDFEPGQVVRMVHGIDTERFRDITDIDIKKSLGLEPDDFLILNMNTNNERKCWDITIRAFIELLSREKMNPRLKLFCGGRRRAHNGYDIPDIVLMECTRKRLDVSNVFENHILFNKRPFLLTDEEVNILYNIGDVGLNTTCGEGFGLTTLEHLYFNKPQVVTAVPALRETLGSHGHLVKHKVAICTTSREPEGGLFMICDYREIADKLQYCFRHPDERPDAREYVKQTYSWTHMYKILDEEFNIQ